MFNRNIDSGPIDPLDNRIEATKTLENCLNEYSDVHNDNLQYIGIHFRSSFLCSMKYTKM